MRNFTGRCRRRLGPKARVAIKAAWEAREVRRAGRGGRRPSGRVCDCAKVGSRAAHYKILGAACRVVVRAPERLQAYEADKGTFDVALEATGSPLALASLFRVVRPGGRVVQLGMMPPGEIPVPANMLMAREIDYVGAFRFGEEFRTAVALLASGRIDVAPILSATMPMQDAEAAFALAADRTRAIKVHLVP